MTSINGKAQTVIKNANIITMESGHAGGTSLPRAEALAMTHGRFLGVGSNEDIEGLVGPGTKVLDLGGKTVLPGFIDAHIHVLNSGVRHVMAADCDVPTLKQVQAGLKERVEKTPASGCRASNSTTPRPTARYRMKAATSAGTTWTRLAPPIPYWWPTGRGTFTT